jgi:hypothetical protein
MNPGKACLWAGISCVGTLVTRAVAMLFHDSANALFAETPGGGPADVIAFLKCFCLRSSFAFAIRPHRRHLDSCFFGETNSNARRVAETLSSVCCHPGHFLIRNVLFLPAD